MDGGNPLVLYKNPGTTIYEIALDHYEQDIYWLEQDPRGERIRLVNLLGGEINTFEIKDGQPKQNFNLYHLVVDRYYVYYVKKLFKNSKYDHLLRARKDNGTWDEEFRVLENGISSKYGQHGEFESILVLSGQPQKIAQDHPCQHDNGGCEDYLYCVAVPDDNDRLTKKCI